MDQSHSSLIPRHWSESDEIIVSLESIYNKTTVDGWYDEFILYLMVIISDSVDKDRRLTLRENTRRIPNFVNQKIFNIVEHIYYGVMDFLTIGECDIDDYQDMLIFEIDKLNQ